MKEGLDDVVAAATVLSDVDGARGRLILRGLTVEDAATRLSFEAMALRLVSGFFPDLPHDAAFAARLGHARVSLHAALLEDDPRLDLPPLEAVRALMASLPDAEDLDCALTLLAAPAVFTAAKLARLRGDTAPPRPDPSTAHAEDVLRMCGLDASAASASALNAYLCTVSDHGLNASTFAARVVASTRAGLTSAALAGLCALKGPLHGGAPGPVIDMLDAIGSADRARSWLLAAVAGGDRLMGFGHRIYQVRDPRADVLKAVVERLAREGGAGRGRLAYAEAVETAALEVLRTRKPDRSLKTNVEFYTALLLEALGFPKEAFTCVFAMGRMAGWIAHAREQAVSGRLIRPQSRYIGPRPDLAA